MTNPRVLRSVVTIFIAPLFSGCTSKVPEPSGFLTDYSQLLPHPTRSGALIYENPDTPQEGYDKCIIDPTSICVGPTRSGVALRGDVVSFLESSLREQLTKAAAEYYELTTEPGPGVLRVRVALTAIVPSKKAEQVYRGAGPMVYWPGSAVIEGESIDSLTGRQISAYVNKSFLQDVIDLDNPDFDAMRKEVQARVAELGDALRHLLATKPD